MKIVYTEAYGKDCKYYINGPAPGGECSYYGGFLYPQFRMETLEEAKRAAHLANIGYEQGYKQAQRDIQRALGIVPN